MLVVKVELWSAITGQKSEIARSVIYNVGGTQTRGDYHAMAMRGGDEKTLHKNMVDVLRSDVAAVHEGSVKDHPRLEQHVWNLVAKALTAMGYGK